MTRNRTLAALATPAIVKPEPCAGSAPTSPKRQRGSQGPSRAIPAAANDQPMRLEFTVPGQPVGKQRPRVVNGRAFTPEQTRRYERFVQLCAIRAGLNRPAKGPVRVTVRVFNGDARRRDLDNVLKSLTDALNCHAFDDDCQIVEIVASKAIDRSNPRAEVLLEELP